MSRAESPARILDAAIALGTAKGSSALSVQGVAGAAGVSKALVLYHFEAKAALLAAIVRELGARSSARLREAAGGRDPQAAWRALVLAECASGELGLLGALSLEPEVAGEVTSSVRGARETAAAAFAERLLGSVGLDPRIPIAFIGRVVLRELDALVVATAREAGTPAGQAVVEAEQDAMLLAILALGR